MALMACADLPAFPLQLLLRQHPDWRSHPAAVVDEDKPQGTLRWVNEEARRSGILPGMRYAAGLSLSRELRAAVVPPSEIAAETSAVAERLRFYTPEVEPSEAEPGIFWLGTEGLGLLHPSLRRWAALIRADLAQLGLEASLAVGFSRFGVYAAARAAAVWTAAGCGSHRRPRRRRRAVPRSKAAPADGGIAVFAEPAEEARAIRRIAIDRLGIDPEVRDALARLGIDTLGGFLDLPAGGILRRFGAEARRLYLSARGDLSPSLRPEIPDEPLVRRVILDHPENDTGRLLALVQRELHDLLEALSARGRELSELTLRMRLDRGPTNVSKAPEPRERSSASEHPRSRDSFGAQAFDIPADSRDRIERIRPARPTLDPAQIGDLVRLRLEAVTLPSGVVDLELEVQGLPMDREQGRLFQAAPHRDRAAGARALARVRARFGDGAVARVRLQEAHLPEARFVWEPVSLLSDARPRHVRVPPLVRRIRLHPEPESASVIREDRSRGDGTSVRASQSGQASAVTRARFPLALVPGGESARTAALRRLAGIPENAELDLAGPYVISGGWWRHPVHRRYYFIRTAAGRWLWVYFDRVRRQWFRQGEVD